MGKFDSPELVEALENIEKRNYAAAFETLLPLAEAKNPKAQCNLANLYHFGWGVRVDGLKAVELYLIVAKQRIREERLSGIACQNLATIYTTGLPGVEPDHEKAREFSNLAKMLGFAM